MRFQLFTRRIHKDPFLVQLDCSNAFKVVIKPVVSPTREKRLNHNPAITIDVSGMCSSIANRKSGVSENLLFAQTGLSQNMRSEPTEAEAVYGADYGASDGHRDEITLVRSHSLNLDCIRAAFVPKRGTTALDNRSRTAAASIRKVINPKLGLDLAPSDNSR